MSRSRKRAPIQTFASGKFDQRQAHSRLRLHSKAAIRECLDWDELIMPLIREVSEIWDMTKENRVWNRSRWSHYYGEWYPDEKAFAKLLRK